MSAFHVVTVGLSILGKLAGHPGRDHVDRLGAETNNVLADNPEIAANAESIEAEFAAKAWGFRGNLSPTPGESSPAIGSPQGQFARVFRALLEDQHHGWRLSSISAEIESLTSFGGEPPSLRVPLPADEADVVILLASATKEGVAAAFWNAGIIAGGDFTRVTWVDGDLEGEPTAGMIYVVRMAALDASVIDFVRRLGVAARSLSHFTGGRRDQRALEFHLSGGFKVVLPFFLAMAEWVASESAARGRVRAWAIHEDSRALVRLPLRRIPAGARSELRLIRELDGRATGPFDRPDGESLLGYAYELTNRAGGKVDAQLTDLGRGYAAFLRSSTVNAP